jgi:SAM-dependent methyltransferase
MILPEQHLSELYRTAGAVRMAGLTAETSQPLYLRYLEFTKSFVPAGRILDVGCGNGWSTYWMADSGLDATGIDLDTRAFEPPARDRLQFVEGSGTRLPFPDQVFDAVTSHQCLEHVPEPAEMLREMIRVTRPGGVVCIVGPNLLGLGPSLRALTRYVWQQQPRRRILLRDAEMPCHPFGNTLPEVLWYMTLNLLLTTRKWLSRRATFTMRSPDLRPPFHSDNDAIYLCNPLDLNRFLRAQGCKVLRDVAINRPGWTRMLAGGTWFAARTPLPR